LGGPTFPSCSTSLPFPLYPSPSLIKIITSLENLKLIFSKAVIIDHVSTGGNAIASVCLSARTSVSTLSFEPTFDLYLLHVYAYVMTIALVGVKAKVRGQGQTKP